MLAIAAGVALPLVRPLPRLGAALGWAGMLVAALGPVSPLAGGRSSGIGLSLCRKIVEAHGGAIMIGAGPAGGAIVGVELPALPPDADAPATPGLAGAG